jgi:RNA polymerase sigma factor (TIGR02999 family)
VSSTGQITRLLAESSKGNREAEDLLMPMLYAELRRLARSYMRKERPNHTLQATALVHEAYMKLVPQRVNWNSRSHFFGVAAQQMRRVLLDYARQHQAEKREGSVQKLQLQEALVMAREHPSELINLEEALERFASEHPRQCRVVELRFFAGWPEDEIARSIGVSVETVKRDWKFAKAWLNLELRKGGQH